MKCNEAGVNLIKTFEGCCLVVYRDLVGLNTVGYGHRTQLPVGTEISQEQADQLLASDLSRFEQAVSSMLRVSVSSNQFSALVCFAYNVGAGNLRHSTLLRLLNQPAALEGVADQFLRWNRAGGVPVEGLTRRREAERQLFLSA